MFVNTACDLMLTNLKTASENNLVEDFICQLVERIKREYSSLNPPEATYEQKIPFIKDVKSDDFKKRILESGYTKTENGFELDIELMKDETFAKIIQTFNPEFSQYEFDDEILESNVFCQLSFLCNGIAFNKCLFGISTLDIPSVYEPKISFQCCCFLKAWELENYHAESKGWIYIECGFVKGINKNIAKNQCDSFDKKVEEISSNQFCKCEIEGDVSLDGLKFKAVLFSETKFNLKKMTIKNTTFKPFFKINDSNLGKLVLTNTVFEGKFELKNAVVKSLNINDCNFHGIADFYTTKFKGSFSIEKTVFKAFAAFEDTRFGIKGSEVIEPTLFKYVTFLSFSNFRNAKFYSGLDLEKSNFSQAPNFLNARVDYNIEATPRETFRIIKNSFDSVGNYLDGNKIFSFEMTRHRLSLSKRWWQSGEVLVFSLNQKASNFGQSFMMPIGWIIGFALIYALLNSAVEHNFFFYSLTIDGYESWRTSFPVCLLNWLDNVIGSISPINKLLTEGLETISLVFNIIFSTLIWQAIVAVKRLTRR